MPCPLGSDRALDGAILTHADGARSALVAKLRRSPAACCASLTVRRMRVHGQAYRTIWLADDGATWRDRPDAAAVRVRGADARDVEDAAPAIRDMVVRGAPLIGVTAAYGVALACAAMQRRRLARAIETLVATRPTAVNLRWALERMRRAVRGAARRTRRARVRRGRRDRDEDVASCAAIGRHGLGLLRDWRTAGRRARQRAHPLQRGLARLRRLGHGTRAGLRRARGRHARARLGRRNAAAQPGRLRSPRSSSARTACRTR